jgi:hypothetical protein
MSGVIGWILAAWPLYFILQGKSGAASRNIFLVAGLASVGLALFSLNLPPTPPKPMRSGEGHFAWLKAANPHPKCEPLRCGSPCSEIVLVDLFLGE